MECSAWDTADLPLWVEKMMREARRVLAAKGLLVVDDGLRAELEAAPGATVRGSRVCFAEDAVSDFLTRYRDCHPFHPPAQCSVSAGAHAHHILDPDGTLRPITLADIETGARLIGALEPAGLTGLAPGIPQDVPPPLQGLAQFIATARNKPGEPACALRMPEAEPFIAECCDILGSARSAGVHVVSPLRLEGQEVETALALRRMTPDCPVWVGTMPIIGVSAPASALAAFITGVAEIVGGAMAFHLTGTAVERLGMSVNAYPFDMREGCFVYGTPANVVCSVIEREVNAYLGCEVPAKSFSVMAQHPGPQACALKGIFTGMMVAQGRRVFSGAGTLSLDEIYSPIQLIYDRELADYFKRAASALRQSLSDELLLADEILDAPGDNFMAADSTLRHFRLLQWDSPVFPSRTLAQWEAAGRPMEAEAAAAEVDRLLAGYDFELAPDITRALDEVYERAARRLL
jgi:trimethylamine:corrinoid methyltransferase-like protein